MLKTPDYKINNKTVYPPSEDTFILLDALESDYEELASLHPQIVLEIGSGSGVVSVFLRQLLSLKCNLSSLISFCTDLNDKALECTRQTAELNSVELIELVRCDLLSALALRLCNSVDILIFNPPYVPSSEPAKNVEDFYYAGGESGRFSIDRILPLVNQILSINGIFYLVALKENNINDIMFQSASQYDLSSKIVLERKCGIEYLFVLKFWKVKTT